MDKDQNGMQSPKVYEGMSQYRPPLCYELVGRTLELVMDSGYDYELSFIDREFLRFGETGKTAAEYRYDCLKGDEDTYLVNFEVTGADPRAGIVMVLDMEQSLVTYCYCTVGQNRRYPKMTKPYIVFGAIRKEDGSVAALRHGYTDDLVGKAICWEYGTLSAGHVYISEHYYRLTLPPDLLEKFRVERPELYEHLATVESTSIKDEPCSMIKIKDGIYVLDMNEEEMCKEEGHGNNLFFLMNLNRMYDIGRSFGYSEEGVPENYTYGAYGAYFDADELVKKKSTALIR